jgi:uncharacterized protein with GYD domain
LLNAQRRAVYFVLSYELKFDERRKAMPSFMVQVAYTSQAVAALVKKPQDRASVVAKAVEKLGGSVKGAWLTFGDYDTMVIVELPDNTSAAAFAMAISAGGSCKSVKTTPLLSVEEGTAAMKKASGSGYKAVS